MTPDAMEVAKWLAIFFFLIGGLNQCLKLKRGWFPDSKPPTGELQGQVDAVRDRVAKLEVAQATSSQVAADGRGKVYTKIEDMGKDQASAMSDLRRDLETKIDGVHERVNEVLKAVARLEGVTQAHHRRSA